MTLAQFRAMVADTGFAYDQFEVVIQGTGGPWDEEVTEVTVDEEYQQIKIWWRKDQ